jgi:hypothetical protein
MAAKFGEATRVAVLGAIGAGASVEAAAHAAGVSPRAVQGWIARGRRELAADQDTPHAMFARALDAARAAVVERGLSQKDLVGLLEVQARKGSVRACALLLERRWERREPDKIDPFRELDEWAEIYGGDNVRQLRTGRADGSAGAA